MKTVLLIGAGGGMGSACARLFLHRGDRVLAVDRPGAQMTEGVIPLFADLTVPEQIENAFADAKAQVDSIDAVVYAAGVYDADSLVEIDEDRMRRIFDVNFFGAYRTLKTFLPLMKRNARIVIVTSELADLDPLPFTGLYGITKGTLDKYAFSLAMELQMLGMRVSVLRPGAVETALLGQSVSRIRSFTGRTALYPGVAAKFLRVTQRVESKSVSPERIAKKIERILSARRPRFSYAVNRNPLLRLYGVLPKRLKLFAIRTYLKTK
ncbi:MAG: SDR family NAD(P)-dependent oxidoreductase [Clostridia bacterium]|nr:SDR family NAD(P)-dependent oxidoreductase [Clostridia bacterium]